MPGLVDRMTPHTASVFGEMTALARSTGALNLGQGYPDHEGPDGMLAAAVDAVRGGRNQYPPGPGVPELRRAVAAHQERRYGLQVDPDSEVLVTAGATEGFAAALLALCERGDEVVVLEPSYDSYTAVIDLAGARKVTVPLRPPSLRWDDAELAAAFSSRTAVVLLNTPHNPTGRVLDRAELAAVVRLADAHDAVVLTDEVYEHLVYPGAEHVPAATLPKAAGRTLSVSSAGKSFACTGWKVGWVTGPADLVTAVRTVKQHLTFVASGPFQPAVAHALDAEGAFLDEQRLRLQRARDLLVEGLAGIGFGVSVPQGGYFVLADTAPLGFDDGLDLCRRLPELAGVVAIPVSAFCADPAPFRSLVRFAFCKDEAVLTEAVSRLHALAPR